MLFQKQVGFELLPAQDTATTYQHVLMGEAYGKLTLK
jgi:hypothetical protein